MNNPLDLIRSCFVISDVRNQQFSLKKIGETHLSDSLLSLYPLFPSLSRSLSGVSTKSPTMGSCEGVQSKRWRRRPAQGAVRWWWRLVHGGEVERIRWLVTEAGVDGTIDEELT